MSAEETRNKELVHRAVAAFNLGDWDAVDRLFAADYVDHDPSRPDLPPGPAGVKQAWAAFPDLEATIEDLVADGDKVAVRGSIRGTHGGDLMGMPPTGRRVTVTLIDVNRIAGGKLAERWAETDTVGLLQQLGAMPGPPASGEADAPSPAATANGNGGGGSPEANKTLARRYADTLLNRHELGRAAEFLAADFVGHFAGAPVLVRGVEGWRQMFGGFLAAFPDYRETVHDVLAEGDRVVARITFSGTHRGELMGLPPTGREVAVGGMAFLRIAGARSPSSGPRQT